MNLIGDVFNLFNIPNLSGRSGDLYDAGFGQATSRVSQVFGSGALGHSRWRRASASDVAEARNQWMAGDQIFSPQNISFRTGRQMKRS
jgi:hypothetical protein